MPVETSATMAQRAERLAQERDEKAAESFMVASLLREADRDPSGFLMAGEYATEVAATLRALAAANVQLERERDEMRNTAAGVTLAMTKARDAANAARLAAEGERDRLREALRKIAGISNECTWTKGTRKLAGDLQDIIRAALTPAPEPNDGE